MDHLLVWVNMFSGVHKHATLAVNRAAISRYPYPHFTVDSIFPKQFYDTIVANSIPPHLMQNLHGTKAVGSGYNKNRWVYYLKPEVEGLPNQLQEFWRGVAKWLFWHFSKVLLQKFGVPLQAIACDILYTNDQGGFHLGPHTDKKRKLLTCLFYLPVDTTNKFAGTSIYKPLDPSFTCPGGPHHKRENFSLVNTVEFLPNRLFCFQKTENSFHGVEPLPEGIDRTLLIFDIQKAENKPC